MGPSVDHPRHHPGLLEHPQVPRDRRLGNAEVPRRLPHRGGAAAEPFDDAPPNGVCKGLERIVSHYANYIVCDDVDQNHRRDAMPKHAVGTQDEWQVERDKLLAEEKELTRRNDELTKKRRDLPW